MLVVWLSSNWVRFGKQTKQIPILPTSSSCSISGISYYVLVYCPQPRTGTISMRTLLLAACLTVSLPLSAFSQDLPKNVIVFIGDGAGASYWTLARFAADALAVEEFKVMGLVDTRSSDFWITDSAAGATAFSTGVRTYNGAIGVGPDSAAVPTVLEMARDQGRATGLVSTSSVTHATPASFAAHVTARSMEFEIARQMVENEVDVILGGGWRWFDPSTRPDSVDLLGRIREGHTYITTPDELAGLESDLTRLVGLFAENHMPAAPERTPSLPEMTRTAIEVLSRDADGFFLMVEASQPDWRGHSNEPIGAVTAEMLDMDRSIAEALRFQASNRETLILVMADHETGGLAVEVSDDSTRFVETAETLINAVIELRAATERSSSVADIDQVTGSMIDYARELSAEARQAGRSLNLSADYTTRSHTGQMIPLFAKGPGAERFGGIIDNYRVGQLLIELVTGSP